MDIEDKQTTMEITPVATSETLTSETPSLASETPVVAPETIPESSNIASETTPAPFPPETKGEKQAHVCTKPCSDIWCPFSYETKGKIRSDFSSADQKEKVDQKTSEKMNKIKNAKQAREDVIVSILEYLTCHLYASTTYTEKYKIDMDALSELEKLAGQKGYKIKGVPIGDDTVQVTISC